MNQIYFAGYDAVHPKDFKYDIPEGFHCFLLVVTTTPALFCVQGEIREYPAHTAILYPPGHEIWYAASGDTYGNHWIRFASDESFVTKFPQQAVPFPVSDPEYCRNLFQLLTWEASQLVYSARRCHNTGILSQSCEAHPDADSVHNDLVISQLLRILFDKLCSDTLNNTGTSHDHGLLSLRRQIAANPQLPWNVADMAKELHVSSGYLQLLYKQKFHTSCMDDVISFRLFKARDLLLYTNESIAAIAELCGYNNTEHFCRQFRKSAGATPGQFRKGSFDPSTKML